MLCRCGAIAPSVMRASHLAIFSLRAFFLSTLWSSSSTIVVVYPSRLATRSGRLRHTYTAAHADDSMSQVRLGTGSGCPLITRSIIAAWLSTHANTQVTTCMRRSVRSVSRTALAFANSLELLARCSLAYCLALLSQFRTFSFMAFHMRWLLFSCSPLAFCKCFSHRISRLMCWHRSAIFVFASTLVKESKFVFWSISSGLTVLYASVCWRW